MQVYQALGNHKHPEILIGQLVNYITFRTFNQGLFLGNREKVLQTLANFAKAAGLNSKVKSDFTDKSQFYSWKQEILRHN